MPYPSCFRHTAHAEFRMGIAMSSRPRTRCPGWTAAQSSHFSRVSKAFPADVSKPASTVQQTANPGDESPFDLREQALGMALPLPLSGCGLTIEPQGVRDASPLEASFDRMVPDVSPGALLACSRSLSLSVVFADVSGAVARGEGLRRARQVWGEQPPSRVGGAGTPKGPWLIGRSPGTP